MPTQTQVPDEEGKYPPGYAYQVPYEQPGYEQQPSYGSPARYGNPAGPDYSASNAAPQYSRV